MSLVVDASVACNWFFEENIPAEARLNETAFEMACVLGYPVCDCQYLLLAQT